MTKLWNDLKKNMKDWSTAAVEKAEEVSKIAVAKTEELTKISKIKIEEHQLQRELSKNYEEMGRMVTSHAKNDNMVNFSGNQEFFNLVEKIDKIQVEIDAKEAAIQRIKEEYDLTDTDVSAAVNEAEANLHTDENQTDFETIVDTAPGEASEGDPKEE
jgi:iron-sulfur cluster repair protein YtfE (RIC family)